MASALVESFECFTLLAEKLPAWVAEVQELERRIVERQNEIARVAVPVTQKLRKSCSNESIRPGKEIREDNERAVESQDSSASPMMEHLEILSAPQQLAVADAPAARQFQRQQTKRKATSILSNASGTPKSRTRSMIIVYYDSVVQTAFDQLVKHISLGRNRIRKAKQAETISGLTEGLQDDDATGECLLRAWGEDLNTTNGSSVPAFRSTRSLVTPNRGTNKPAGVLSEVDKALETAQSFCEIGAHRFLREGNCNEQISGAKEAFQRAAKISKEELNRLEAQAREAERQRRERNRLSAVDITASGAGLPPELGGVDGPIEADDSSDAEYELPPMPTLRYRQMART